MTVTLSVVIVNYNTRDFLRDCLQSLAQSTQPAEIIVVDNASSDGSADMVCTEFPDVRLLAQSENTWFCGGNNIGIEASTGDYVLLLNPDTVVFPDALQKLVNFMQTHPDYAGVTAQLHYPDGTTQRTCSRIPSYPYLLMMHTPLGWLMPSYKRRLMSHHWYDDENFTREHSRDVSVLPGSCLLMRRANIRLDDDLLLYFPEDDLAQRFKNRKFHFVADAKITHREKSATRSWLAARIYFRDMLIYTRKHHKKGRATLLWMLTRPLWIAMWLRAKLGV